MVVVHEVTDADEVGQEGKKMMPDDGGKTKMRENG